MSKRAAKAIFDRISDGHRNAVARPDHKWTDRKLREMINEANKNGDCIVCREDGQGYYRPIPSDPVDNADYNRYMAQEHSRINDLQLKQTCMEVAYESRRLADGG